MSDRTRVLAVGIDAAEWGFLSRLIDAGELPVLAGLYRDAWHREVRAGADIGSGAVWPSFSTGTPPAEHQQSGGWVWNAGEMRLDPLDVDSLAPFWRSADSDGLEWGILDVPFSPHAGLGRGFEVTEWGPHDVLAAHPRVSPASAEREVGERHPFRRQHRNMSAPEDPPGLQPLVTDCARGARLRGELLERLIRSTTPDVVVGVFGEAHHCAHEVWHTAEPDHPFFAGAPDLQPCPDRALVEIHREIDRQLGALIEAVGEDAAVIVFSLHGMGPVRGRAVLLQPLLEHLGFAHPAAAAQRSRAAAALAFVKARTPGRVKRLYDRVAPHGVKLRVARPNMLPPLDWARTRAFAMPSDQHGWLRVNLRGRERDGLVDRAEYDEVLTGIERALASLRTSAGKPLVADFLRTATEGGGPPLRLPDLIVHWADAVFERGARVAGVDTGALTDSPRLTGQHRPAGFMLAKGIPEQPEGPVSATDLHALIAAAARAKGSPPVRRQREVPD